MVGASSSPLPLRPLADIMKFHPSDLFLKDRDGNDNVHNLPLFIDKRLFSDHF